MGRELFAPTRTLILIGGYAVNRGCIDIKQLKKSQQIKFEVKI
jgi:hypothetical protein